MPAQPKPRRLDEPIAVSLEDLVPPSNFYRHLEAQLDLSFVRGWTRECYAERGRPSIDPVVFFKLQLVMFFRRSPLRSTKAERGLPVAIAGRPRFSMGRGNLHPIGCAHPSSVFQNPHMWHILWPGQPSVIAPRED